MTGMLGLRKRLPLLVFLLLFVLLLMLVGLACACFGDSPLQALERALASFVGAPALIEVWLPLAQLALPATLLLLGVVAANGRASPAQLQRFLF
ncbi:MAG: hypothetical protein H0W14_01060 [Actinobacteria bacterium]|nr:hypothetical protein [Actinomycetota bacterium]